MIFCITMTLHCQSFTIYSVGYLPAQVMSPKETVTSGDLSNIVDVFIVSGAVYIDRCLYIIIKNSRTKLFSDFEWLLE